MNRLFEISAVVALAAAGFACKAPGDAGNSSVPPLHSAQAARISEASLNAGRSLYIRKCARCHRFYDPAAYSDAEWKFWMQKMSRKSRLTSSEEEVLSTYLQSFRQSNAGESVH